MMRVSVERLRVLLLAGAGLLVVVIASFLGYAHLQAKRLLHDLPGRLGADITRESNGFTYSQSSKGKTVYTIHAAKLVQRKDGKTTLRDVGIVLYGQEQDRADRIYGEEFEYDQKAGVVRAMGVVHLDLQAPVPADAHSRAEYAAGRNPAGTHREGETSTDDRLVHVKTSGLVFVQSLGIASTDQPIEFRYKGLTGEAKGADYSSDTGITVLQSDVRISGLHNGQPVLLTASHAEMDRTKQELTLLRARYVSVGESGAGKNGNRTLTAEQAVVHLRSDGSAERLLASGGVTVEQAGGTLKARDTDVSLNAQSRPETARLAGGVTYAEDDPLRQTEARSGNAVARFDTAGRVHQALMTEQMEMHVRERATSAASWNERTLTGGSIDMTFATTEDGRLWLREGVAAGDAHMRLVDRTLKGAATSVATSELRAATLTAKLEWDGHAARLSHLSGTGHTEVRRRDATGAEDTSQGETLDVSFATVSGAGGTGGSSSSVGASGNQISRAVQRGGVAITYLPARKPGTAEEPTPLHGTGAEASFDGAGHTLTLSGQAHVTQADREVRAGTIAVRRDTSDARADGSVEASYGQAGSAQTTHVLAATAEFRHSSGRALFYGAPGVPARLWQGGSQVEAPTIEFGQQDRTLVASGGAETSGTVRTVLVSGEGKMGATTARRPAAPRVMRITSRSLRYAEADRRAVFGGGVVLQDANGTVKATQIVAMLKGTSGAGNVATGVPAGFIGGSVDRVTADGAVEVSERDRRAEGERLIYTATDSKFVLTGTASKPPEVVDEVQGTVTGAALEFHAGDNSVMVLGSTKDGEGRRVRTETQVRPQ